jgi:hypothetical protein
MSYVIYQSNLDDEDSLEQLRYLQEQEIPVIQLSKKRMERNNQIIHQYDKPLCVIGDVQYVQHYMKYVHNKPWSAEHYPDCLKPWLYREIYVCSFKNVRNVEGVFIKPYNNVKAFTGKVISRIARVSYGYNKLVYVSQVVKSQSEYRYFICNGEIIDYKWYDGDRIEPDINVVNEMIQKMTESGKLFYLLDVGVLSDGRPSLIETDNAYSFGTYGCTPEKSIKIMTMAFDNHINNIQ